MKKFYILALVTIFAMPMFAQRLTPEERANRDYSSWLPQAGDFSIGFGLDPISTFVGNMFNGNAGNSLGSLTGESLSIKGVNVPTISVMGSYMLSDKLAVRANIALKMGNSTTRSQVLDVTDPKGMMKVMDRMTNHNNSGSLSAGIEYRVGSNRPIQAVFGAGLLYGFDVSNVSYHYGNAYEKKYSNSLGYINVNAPDNSVKLTDARTVAKYNINGNHGFGAYGSIGVEWFVAPQVALGANVNLKLAYVWEGKAATKYEGWDTVSASVKKYKSVDEAYNSHFNFGTDNIGCNLYVAFYFHK